MSYLVVATHPPRARFARTTLWPSGFFFGLLLLVLRASRSTRYADRRELLLEIEKNTALSGAGMFLSKRLEGKKRQGIDPKGGGICLSSSLFVQAHPQPFMFAKTPVEPYIPPMRTCPRRFNESLPARRARQAPCQSQGPKGGMAHPTKTSSTVFQCS